MSQIIIAQASVASLSALNKLFAHAVDAHFSYFPQAVRRQVIRDHRVSRLFIATVHPRRVVLTARSNGQIIGYAIGAAPVDGSAQLYWLYVAPEYRGANVGLSLLSRMLKVLRLKGARTVSIATHDHRSYYERQGFSFVDRTEIHGVDMDILTYKFA